MSFWCATIIAFKYSAYICGIFIADILDFIKVKNFCSVKDTVKENQKASNLEKIVANYTCNKGLESSL